MGLLDSLFNSETYGGQQGGLLDFLRNMQMQNSQYQPSAGFPADPSSASFADRFNAMPPPPTQVPELPPAQTIAPAPSPNKAQPIAVGGYQMPRIGSAPQYIPDPAAIPQNAQPTQGQMPTDVSAQSRQPQQQPQGGPDFGDKFLTGAQSFLNGGGLISAIRGAANNQRTDPVGIALQDRKAQFDAFVGAGLSPQNAMLAVMNPEAGKVLISEALSNKEKYQKTGVDAFGNETYGFVNERTQTINGKTPSAADSDTGGQSSGGFLASGVKSIDSSLTGQDYLKQFSPEIQAAVQNYVDGKSTPTGNPRKGFTQTVKMIAQKYGADIGQSADDASFAARKTMRNQLSSSAPSSLGGQINIGNTAAGHLADLTKRALELGNYDTGIAPLTSLVNNARGLGTEQAAKMEALKGAAQHYGQEITKFYAGSPGGVAERDRFIESVNGARSPKELAAILATEGELMRSRLDALGGQIRGVLGEEGLRQYPVLRPDGQAALARVEENVSRLKGGQGAVAPQSKLPSGWSVQVR